MRKLALLIAAPLVLIAACSAASTTTQGRGSEAGAPAPSAVDSVSGFNVNAASAPDKGIPTVVVSPDRNLILTAKIVMRSKDPWATSDRAQAIASGLGGDVLNLTQSGSGDTRSASLTIRVPSRRFADGRQQLRTFEGEAETPGVRAQDDAHPSDDLR